MKQNGSLLHSVPVGDVGDGPLGGEAGGGHGVVGVVDRRAAALQLLAAEPGGEREGRL